MTEPIKLPPLTVKMLMDVFGSHADIPPALLCTSWKDGIDIDETSMRAQMLVEAYARLAVEQATAELRAEIEMLRADAERYRHLCEYQRWAPEIEAAFDCSPKVLIDEAIDNSIKAMKELTK
jgi:hypothetical protein